MEQFTIEPLPKDGEKLLDALKNGLLVAVRSKNDFMYVLMRRGNYLLYLHTPGSPSGGQKRFEVNDKYTAIIKNFAALCDMAFAVTFDEQKMELYAVLAGAEDAILEKFPGGDRNADGTVDFGELLEGKG
ncbi:MAG: hypothetical protein LBT88_08215 [Oscillospiraceae bacterium]|jgi:hypothetical protein|nr:hypothetical protein [Oscillospiraceae bacterium]